MVHFYYMRRLAELGKSRFIALLFAVVFTVNTVPSYSAGNDAKDSGAATTIRDVLVHPTAVSSLGMVGGSLSRSLDAGLRGQLLLNNHSKLSLSAMAGVFLTADSTLTASLIAKVSFELQFSSKESWSRLTWCSSVNAGRVDLNEKRLLQILSGLKWQFPLGSSKWRQFLPVDVVTVSGYGYDLRHDLSREIVNIGFQIEDLIFISFDIASLWKDMSPVIYVARL